MFMAVFSAVTVTDLLLSSFFSFTPQECNIMILTNARLDEEKMPNAPKNGMIINNTVCDPLFYYPLLIKSPSCGHLAYYTVPPISILQDSILIIQRCAKFELSLIHSLSSSRFYRKKYFNGREVLEHLDGCHWNLAVVWHEYKVSTERCICWKWAGEFNECSVHVLSSLHTRIQNKPC